jgi:hypothetical protein
MNHTTYQLIKIKSDKTEKVVLETSASSVERAMDYFYLQKPKSYRSEKYRIGIKPKPEFILD